MTPLQIFVLLPDPRAPASHERKLLEILSSDDRYRLAGLIEARQSSQRAPTLTGAVIALEAAVLAPERARATPAFDRLRRSVPIFREAEAEIGPRGAAIDVIVDLTADGAAPHLAASARFGVWRLSPCDRLAGFREAARGAATVGVDLVRRTASSPQGETIARAEFNLKFGASRNAAALRHNSIALLRRELARLHATRRDPLGVVAPAPRKPPSLLDLARYEGRFLAGLVARAAHAAADRLQLRPRMWALMAADGAPETFDPRRGRPIAGVGDGFCADPFLLKRDDGLFLFYEAYDYAAKRGHISVAKHDGKDFAPIGVALKADYHLSFPFVFAVGDDFFMMPETHQAKRLEIWRATNFPTGWTPHATALSGVACADSAIVFHRGAWWLFTNISDDDYNDFCSELHLYRMDGPLLENLTPHPLNPVVVDARRARGAGRVFERDGRLFRMSQDNEGEGYGYGVNIMEITQLDMSDYQEKVVRTIRPTFDPALIGCHHIDFADDFVVFDVCKRFGGRADGQ